MSLMQCSTFVQKGAWCNKTLYPPPMNTIAVIAILSTPYILITYKFLSVNTTYRILTTHQETSHPELWSKTKPRSHPISGNVTR